MKKYNLTFTQHTAKGSNIVTKEVTVIAHHWNCLLVDFGHFSCGIFKVIVPSEVKNDCHINGRTFYSISADELTKQGFYIPVY